MVDQSLLLVSIRFRERGSFATPVLVQEHRIQIQLREEKLLHLYMFDIEYSHQNLMESGEQRHVIEMSANDSALHPIRDPSMYNMGTLKSRQFPPLLNLPH